jgi:4-amino-4-deoxy-L-arabinose transferase-like glycosyltransferase
MAHDRASARLAAPPSDSSPSPLRPHRRRWALAGVLVLAAVLLIIPAGRRPVWSSDEARFMVLAQDILDHGRWLVPELRDRPYMNKPQMFFWAIALASWPSGQVTEATAAIPPVLSAVATVGGVMAIGTLLWGWTPGLLAGLVLATTPAFFSLGYQVLADVMVTAWMVWALYFLLRARRDGWTRGALAGFYLCVGAGVLSKGPMASIALLAAAVPAVVEMGWIGLRRLRPGMGLLVLVVLLFPWVASYLAAPGGSFTNDVLVGHYGTWLFQGRLLDQRSVLTVLAEFLPWTVVLGGAAAWWRRAPDPDRRWVFLWTATIWVIVGLSGVHRDRYFLPVYPGLALLTADFVARGRDPAARPILRPVTWLVAGFAALGAGVLLSPFPRDLLGEARAFAPESLAEALAIGSFLLVGAAAFVLATRRGAPVVGATGLALGLAGLLAVAGTTQPSRYAADVDVRSLAAVAREQTPAGSVVMAYPDLRLSYDFYLRRQVVTPDRASLERTLAGVGGGVLIVARADWASLRTGAGPSWRVLAARPVSGREMLVVVGSERGR